MVPTLALWKRACAPGKRQTPTTSADNGKVSSGEGRCSHGDAQVRCRGSWLCHTFPLEFIREQYTNGDKRHKEPLLLLLTRYHPPDFTFCAFIGFQVALSRLQSLILLSADMLSFRRWLRPVLSYSHSLTSLDICNLASISSWTAWHVFQISKAANVCSQTLWEVELACPVSSHQDQEPVQGSWGQGLPKACSDEDTLFPLPVQKIPVARISAF